MIKKLLLCFLCLSLFLSVSTCKKKTPTQPDVPELILPVIEHFTASPGSITPGGSSTLSWSTKNATNVTINQGVGTVSATGTTDVSPLETTTYTLTATNSDGKKTQSCIVSLEPIVESITVISSSELLYVGVSEIFMATAIMSDGSTQAVVGGVWGVDDPRVAMVDAITGEVTIIGSGWINVFVDYEGKQGSKAIRGLPNYQGTWTGTYRIDSCVATGDFDLTGFCNTAVPGTVLLTDLLLTQNQDQVTGRFYLGTISADAIGPVAIDGRLVLNGKVEGNITIDVIWQLQSTTPGQITGTLEQLWQGLGAGMSGQALLTCSIVSLSRTSTMARVPFAERPLMTLTLQDLLRALFRR